MISPVFIMPTYLLHASSRLQRYGWNGNKQGRGKLVEGGRFGVSVVDGWTGLGLPFIPAP